MRALISVYDKRGLEPFAKGLVGLGWELVASGGTAAHLETLGLPVTTVESLTGFPEMLGGRVKTLHPKIHAGILARREVGDDLAALAEHEIEPIDLVCVTLYPFEQVAGRRDASEAEAIEMIDVGGPSLLRGAAKNHTSVTPLCRPEDYQRVLDELQQDGEVSPATRRRLAARRLLAHRRVRRGDRVLAGRAETSCPTCSSPPSTKRLDLPYGENPHQQAAYYVERGTRTPAPLARRAAARTRALVQQPQRPECGPAARARVRPARLRDRQAREPMRRRGRRDDRGGVRRAPSPATRSRRTVASSC